MMDQLTTLARALVRLIGIKDLATLVLLATSITLLEALSVSAIIPAIAALVGDKSKLSFGGFLSSESISSFYDYRHLALLGLLTIFLLKNAFLAYVTYKQSQIVFSKQRDMAKKILSNYLGQTIEESERVSTPELIRGMVNDLSNTTHGVLLPFVILMSEVSLIVGATLVILVFDFYVGMMVAATIIVSGLPMIAMNRAKLSKWGRERHSLEGERLKFVQETVAGLREVKLYGLERKLVEKANVENGRYAELLTNTNFLQGMPRVYLESVGVAALCTAAMFLLSKERSNSDVLIFLSLIGAAAFRILPSLAKSLAQMQAIRFYFPSVSSTLKYVDSFEDNRKDFQPSGTLEAPHAVNDICVQDLHYQYPGARTTALQGVALKLEKGNIAALIGKTGSGKSTLVDCLVGIRSPLQGKVLVNGQDPRPNLRSYQNSIAYVPQHPVILHDSIRANIALSRHLEGISTDPNALHRALYCSGLNELLESLGMNVDDMVMEGGKSLSGGQRQRIAIARAIYKGASFLVLDEATSAMDRVSEREIITRIVQESRASIVLIVTHRIEILEMCNKVFEIASGKIFPHTDRPEVSFRIKK